MDASTTLQWQSLGHLSFLAHSFVPPSGLQAQLRSGRPRSPEEVGQAEAGWALANSSLQARGRWEQAGEGQLRGDASPAPEAQGEMGAAKYDSPLPVRNQGWAGGWEGSTGGAAPGLVASDLNSVAQDFRPSSLLPALKSIVNIQ